MAVKLPVRSRYGVEAGLGGLSSSGLVTAVDTWPTGQVRGMNQGCPEPAMVSCGLCSKAVDRRLDRIDTDTGRNSN